MTKDVKAGRPKRSDADLLSDRAKVKAQIFGANNEIFQFDQDAEIYLPPPPAKKGTSLWKAWAMESFLECIRYGLTYTEACNRIGVKEVAVENMSDLDDLAAQMKNYDAMVIDSFQALISRK